MMDEAIQKKLNELRYAKPKDWFVFLGEVERLGCPTDDQIEQFAEAKATRDIIEHNAGIVNATYLEKAGSKARFSADQSVEVSDEYLAERWQLMRQMCNDMVSAAQKVL